MGVKKNFAFNALLSISQIIFPIITFPYVTRILMPRGLGTINFIDSIVQYLVIASALGIPMYGVREIARIKSNREALSKTYSELFIIHLTLSILFCAFFWLMTCLVPKLTENYQLCMIGVGIILSNVFLVNWFYTGLEKFAFISIVSIVIRTLTIASIFIFVRSPNDKEFYYALNLIGNIITGLICIVIASRYVNFTVKSINVFRHLRSLFLLFSLTVVTSVYVLLDSVILGFLRNNVEVGYYATAIKLSKIPISLLAALTSVLIPKLSSLKFGEEFRTLLNKSVNISFLISIPIAFGLFVLSEELILVFAGDLYLPSLTAFRILSFIIIPIGFALVNYQVLLPYNREKFMMTCAIIGVIVSLSLNFILIPYVGNVGSAISSLTTEIVVSLVLYTLSRRLCKFNLPYKMIVQSVITCCLFFIVRYFATEMFDSQYIIVIFTSFFSALLYFIIMGLVFKVQLIYDLSLVMYSKIFNIN